MNEHAEHHASKFTTKQRTIALVIVALAFVMDLLDTTIVNIAIPSIQTGLGASYATIQWLIAGYALTFAILLITGGRMGDVFGYKKMFLTGVAGFTLASLLCGVAASPEMLIAARLLQGSMAALMVPQIMSLMQIMYKPHERSQVMGLFGALGGLSATLGPIVGGVLIHANIFGWDWRPIFLINIPVGLFAFFAAVKFLPKGKSAHPLKLDFAGTGLVVLALGLLIFPLIQGRELDWPAWTFIMLTSSIPAFAFFVWHQRRKDARDGSALIVPSMFTKRTFVSGMALNIIQSAAMVGYFLTLTLSIQAGLGYDVIKAALTGIPTAIGIGASIGLVSQLLIPKLGRYVITLGTVVMAVGLLITWAVMNHFGLDTQPLYLSPGLLITGLGLGCIMAPVFSISLQDVDIKHAGAASGVLNAIQQIGGAVGIAVVGVLFFGQLQFGASDAFDRATPQLRSELSALQLPAQAQDSIIAATRTCFTDIAAQKDQTKLPVSCQTAMPDANTQAGAKVKEVIMHAAKVANASNFVDSFRAAMTYMLALMAVVFGLSFALPKKFKVVQEA